MPNFVITRPPWRIAYRYVEASGHPGALDQILVRGIPARDPAKPFLWFSATFFRFQGEAEDFLSLPGRAEAAVVVDLRNYAEPERVQWKPTNPVGRQNGGGLECELPLRPGQAIPRDWIVEQFRTETGDQVVAVGNPGSWAFVFEKA